jgi:CheY-like chemotaxis protein
MILYSDFEQFTWTEFEKEKKCHEAGIDGYISKPFDPERLLQYINELALVDGHSRLQDTTA